MKLTSFVVAVVAIVMGLMVWSPRSSAAQNKSVQVERGRYLVEQVARCGDCHSPGNEEGKPIPGRELRGGALMFKPTTTMPRADKAPNIAGSARLGRRCRN